MSLLNYLAFLLGLGVIAQWLAWRLKLPSILLLLLFGFGLSQLTGMQIDDYLQGEEALLSLVGFFVAIILFEGGLTLKFTELKEAGTPVRRLCTYAVVIAFVLTTVVALQQLGVVAKFYVVANTSNAVDRACLAKGTLQAITARDEP